MQSRRKTELQILNKQGKFGVRYMYSARSNFSSVRTITQEDKEPNIAKEAFKSKKSESTILKPKKLHENNNNK